MEKDDISVLKHFLDITSVKGPDNKHSVTCLHINIYLDI